MVSAMTPCHIRFAGNPRQSPADEMCGPRPATQSMPLLQTAHPPQMAGQHDSWHAPFCRVAEAHPNVMQGLGLGILAVAAFATRRLLKQPAPPRP